MEQILKKADAYDWISSLKKTLENHLSKVAFDEIKDDDEDKYFIRAIFPIMNDQFQREIQNVVFWNYWNNGHVFQLDLHYLCNSIIDGDKVNMGKRLLECAQYCKSIIQFLTMYRKDTPEMVKEKEYREQLTEIGHELFELCERLILEHPDQQEEIKQAYKGNLAEIIEKEMPPAQSPQPKKQAKFSLIDNADRDKIIRLYDFLSRDNWFTVDDLPLEDFLDLVGKADFRGFYDNGKKHRTKVRFIIHYLSKYYPGEWFAQSCELLNLDAKQMGRHANISERWLKRWKNTFHEPKQDDSKV